MQADMVRCGVIGAGKMGAGHAELLAKDANATFVAVADVRRAVAESVASAWAGVAYEDYEEMIDKEDLDLAIIATPDALHMAPAMACCQAGIKNLVIQKPLATKLEEARAIMEAAEGSGTQVFVWYSNRGFVSDMATKYAITSGMIGRVIYGDIAMDDNVNVPRYAWGERTREWVAGSSPAQFLTTHALDRLMWYSGAHVQKVYAIEQRELLKYTPDLIDAFLLFDSGLKARVRTGWVHHVEASIESGEQFNGTHGQIISLRSARYNVARGWQVNLAERPSFEELDHHQQVLRKRGLSTRIFWRDTAASGWNPGIAAGLEVMPAETLNRDILSFVVDALVEGTIEPESWRAWQGAGPLPMGDVALENVRVIDAIERSIRTGLPVEITQQQE